MYYLQPEALNNLKVTTSCGANDLVTRSRSAIKVPTIRGATDSVTAVQQRKDQILPSVKHIHQRI